MMMLYILYGDLVGGGAIGPSFLSTRPPLAEMSTSTRRAQHNFPCFNPDRSNFSISIEAVNRAKFGGVLITIASSYDETK